MIGTVRRLRFVLLFIAAAACSALGLNAALPTLSQHPHFGVGVNGQKLASNTQCVPENADSDDIYFLSCGGIY